VDRARLADILTTRTIAGVAFNGSANISLNNNAITNGAGYTTNVGDITGVNAGTNMSGGGSSGTVTLNCTITNNNQLSNGNGYITASSSNTLTNKSGNISQWANDSGYVTSSGGSMSSWVLTAEGAAGTSITNGETVDFDGGTNITTSRSGNTITINNGINNNNQLTNGAGYVTSSGGSMSSWIINSDSGSGTITNGATMKIAGGTNISTSESGGIVTVTNSISNNTQIANGRGFITAGGNISQFVNNSGYITASSSNTLTNKSGNISQWTNDSGYSTSNYSSWTATGDSGSASVTSGGTLIFDGGTGQGIETLVNNSGSGGTVSFILDIHNLGIDTPLTSDYFAFSDESASGDPTKRATIASIVALAPQGDITGITANDGLSGGGTSGTVPIQVDNTVVRTTGTQSISGQKFMNDRFTVSNILDADIVTFAPVQFSIGYNNNPFGASPGSSIKLLNMSGGQNSLANVSQPTAGAYYVAPQDGRIKQIVLRNVATVPTSRSTRIKIYKNGANTYTSSYVTGVGTNAIGWYVDFDNINHNFSQYDRIQIAFQGSSSACDWEKFNMTMVAQYSDYEF